jgi:glycosyltransferase involved in cell wall biosynthesis
MDHLPSVSVVIPTCGRPQFLREALASVAAQTHRPQQVIVVEDGEGAGMANIEASAPVQVIAGPRRGPGAARNAGLEAARGELVAFLDDDDLWHPQKLALQVEWFGRRTRLGLLGTGAVRGCSPSWTAKAGRSRRRRLSTVSATALIRANRLVTSSVIVRRECFRECGGFAESLVLAQDWDMWLRIAGRWEVAVLPASLTFYRLHDGQRSASALQMRRWEVEVLHRYVAGRCPRHTLRRPRGACYGGQATGGQASGDTAWVARARSAGGLASAARRRLAWARCRLGGALLREGRLAAAAEALRTSVRENPLGLLAWARLAQCRLARRELPGEQQI